MKKTLFIVLTALLTCAYVNAVEVNSLAGLKSALTTGGEIKLTANITASEALNITKATTIDGNGFALKNTNTDALGVNTSEAVVIKNLTVYAAHASNGRAIGVNATTSNITLDNVVFNCNARGVTYNSDANDNCVLNVKNSTIQYVLKNTKASATTLRTAEVDVWGNPLNINYDECAPGKQARGISLWEMKHSTVTIDNSTIQGFDYDVNCAPDALNGDNDYTGTSITATKSIFKGRCAYNIHVGNAEFEFTDCTVTGVNCFGGSSESFACFVLDTYSNHCKLTINGGSVATARFTDNAYANNNAREFMVTNRGSYNEIVINNASYTCDKDLGDNKGGVIEYMSTGSVEINGGTYDCPQIVQGFYVSTDAEIVITGGEFNISTVSATDGAYEPMEDPDTYSGITINGGTFVITDSETGVTSDIEDLHAPGDEGNNFMGTAVESYENQDGSYTVVPVGTEAGTKQVDPAVKTNLVWGSDIASIAVNVKLQPTQTLTLASGVATANKLDMGQDTKIIVKDGTILTIGEGGVALNNDGEKDPQIVVEAGGKLILHGQMYGSVTGNILIETSESKQGILLFDPEMNTYGDNHPNGTVEFISKSYYNSGSDYQYERFGIPTWNALQSVTCSATGKNTDFYIFQKSWKYIGRLTGGTPFANASSMNTPFVACNLIAYRGLGEAALKYQFAGALNGNANAVLSAENTWTPFANSYTADIDLATLLTSLASGPANIDDAVYLARKTGLGQYAWDAYSIEWLEDLEVTKIVPMQSFCLYNTGDVVESMTLNYKNMVWTPATSAAPAPRRYAADDNTAKLRIAIENEQGVWDNVKMLESSTNARKTVKYMNEDVNFYINGSDNNLAIVTADNIEDTYFGFSTVKGGNFTISFTNVAGREFEFVDLATNKAVKVAEGNTYTFTAAPNTVADYRFKLVGIKKVPTAVDNLNAAKNQTGIYTIMGQYVGEMNLWNSLPAGVYVVNGEKRVK